VKKIDFSDIEPGEIEKMMNYKLPCSMYSSAVLLVIKDGRFCIEDGNSLYEVQEIDPDYEYLQHVANMKNPHEVQC